MFTKVRRLIFTVFTVGYLVSGLFSTTSHAAEVNALWVAESGGTLKVATADGTVLFEIANPEPVRAVAVDPQRSQLWASTSTTLYVYQLDGTPVTNTPLPDLSSGHGGGGHHGGGGMGHTHTESVMAVDELTGEVWLAIDYHLLKFDAQAVLLGNWTLTQDIEAITLDETRTRLWVATSSSVTAYLTTDFSQTATLDLGTYPHVEDVAYDLILDELWVAMNK